MAKTKAEIQKNYEKRSNYKSKKKYTAKTMQGFYLSLHKENDKDIIEKLQQMKSKQGYIKELIRKDLQNK